MAEASFLGNLTKGERDELIRKLYKLQEGHCYISGESIDLSVHQVDLDHIIARARGGPDDESNIGLALSHHNRSKGVRDLELQRRVFSFYKDLLTYSGHSPGGAMFTVGDVLRKVRGDGRAVSVNRLDGDLVRLAWTSLKGEPRTMELALMTDDKADGVVRESCFGRLPPEIVHHSDLNPRSIHDLEPMIEEFYYRHPQMQPSLAFFQPGASNEAEGRIMLFDGQHKAAAQLYNQCDGLLCRVFLAPCKAVGEEFAKFLDELRRTNFRAHTKLAQLHFAQFTEDKVGHTLYVDEREELKTILVQRGVEASDISEKRLHRAARETNPEEARDFKDQHSCYLRYEVLTTRDLELMKFVETLSARSRRFPLSYETLKHLLDVFLYRDLAEEPLAETDNWRVEERENLAKLLDLIAQEALVGKFQLDIGVYKLDEKIEGNPAAVPLGHLRAYRLCRKPALTVWADVLRDALSQYLALRGKYQKTWYRDRPLWAMIEPIEWEAFRRGIKAIISHKVWAENQKHLVGTLASTRKKDWESILLEGKLPGRPEKLYPELNLALILKAMTTP